MLKTTKIDLLVEDLISVNKDNTVNKVGNINDGIINKFKYQSNF